MTNLFFIRGEFLTDITYHVEDKTEVSVYGDIAGYRYLWDCLRRARTSGSNIHLSRLNPRSNTMQCTIVRPNRDIPRRRVKFIERLIFRNRKPQMELAIYGTVKGFDYLIEYLQDFVEKTTDNIDYHVHLDDMYDPAVAKRSVNLRLTDPLKVWSKTKVATPIWREIFVKRSDSYLPKHPMHRFDLESPAPYSELDPKKDEYLFSLK